MIRQSKRRRDNRQGWIRVTASREQRTPGDIQIAHMVHFGVSICYAHRSSVAHSCGSHMVAFAQASLQRDSRIGLNLNLYPAEGGASNFLRDQCLRFDDSFVIYRRYTPIQRWMGPAKRIFLVGQKNAAVPIRSLLNGVNQNVYVGIERHVAQGSGSSLVKPP